MRSPTHPIEIRRALRFAVIALVGVLSSGFAYALLASMQPGAHTRAQYATIVQIPEDRQGQKQWRFQVHDRLLWIVFPDASGMAALRELDAVTLNSAYPPLAREAKAWAFWGESTYLGCWVAYREPRDERQQWWSQWRGGFIDPCHYGWWDIAGRSIGIDYQKHGFGSTLKNLPPAEIEYLGDGKFLVYRNFREPRR